MAATQPASQTLFIDADDTLWENNIYFEHAIQEFVEFLNHSHYTPEQVRQLLYQIERDSILAHGYGLKSFTHSLIHTFERLSVEPVTPELHERICGFAAQIAARPVELIAGVTETLTYLASRHHLMMLTKGDVIEQLGKVERSGLKTYFNAIEVVAEKDKPTYESMMAKYDLSPETTWMIGNSPKSDINPALSIGLSACFVPHDMTWALEHEELGRPSHPGSKLLVLESFQQLMTHF
jgi:putative hydrolase of the HAD superfamily